METLGKLLGRTYNSLCSGSKDISLEGIKNILNKKILDLTEIFSQDSGEISFKSYNLDTDDEELKKKIIEAYYILRGYIEVQPGCVGTIAQRLRSNTDDIFFDFHNKYFSERPGRIHIIHLHGGLENKTIYEDAVFRTKANIIGYLPLGGYGVIKISRQYQLYREMCVEFKNGNIPVLLPPCDTRQFDNSCASEGNLPVAMALKGLLFPNYIIQTEPLGNVNSFGITICDGKGGKQEYYSTIDIAEYLDSNSGSYDDENNEYTRIPSNTFPYTVQRLPSDYNTRCKNRSFKPETPYVSRTHKPPGSTERSEYLSEYPTVDKIVTNHDRLNFHLSDYINKKCDPNDLVVLPFCSEIRTRTLSDTQNVSVGLYILSLNMIIGDYLHSHLINNYGGALRINREDIMANAEKELLKQGIIWGNYGEWMKDAIYKTSGIKTHVSDSQRREVAVAIMIGFTDADHFEEAKRQLKRCQSGSRPCDYEAELARCLAPAGGGSKRSKRKSRKSRKTRKSRKKRKSRKTRKSKKKTRRTKRR